MEKLLIHHKLPSLIRSNLKIFVSIALIASMGMITLIALLSSYQTLSVSLDDFRRNYALPDITITTAIMTDDSNLLDSVETINGVEATEARLVMDMQLTRKDGRGITGRLMGYSENASFNNLNIIESGGTGEGIPLSIEQYFAGLNNIVLGDSMTITVNDTKFEAYVSRIVSTFEAISVTRNVYTYFDTMDFGYVYISDDDLQHLSNSPMPIINQIFVSVKEGFDADTVLDEIEKLDTSAIQAAYTYKDSPQKTVLDNSVIPLKALSFTIPPLLYLITLLITYLFIYQVIQEQRHEIGVLQALGFSSGQIRGLYFSFSLAISAISVIIGIPVGLFLTRFLSGIYKTCYGIPSIHYIYDIRVIVLAMAVTTFVGLLGTNISAKSILKISPAEAMREKSAQQVVAPTAKKLVASLNSVAKVAISSSLRNKRRVLLSLASVILTGVLLLISVAYSFSVRDIVDHTFNDRYQYDCQIYFGDETDRSGILRRLSSYSLISEMEPVGMKSVAVSFGNSEQDALICGIQKDNSMIRVFDSNREILQIPEDGIILEAHIAADLGVNKGDLVQINGTAVEVSAISKENINYTQYCSLEAFERIFGIECFNSAVVTMTNPTDEIGFYNAISESENFSYLSYNSIQEQCLKSSFSTTNAGIYTMIVCAFIVGSLIIYNMSVINIKERIRDYAVMRILGVSTRAIALGTYLEILIQFVISIIISLGFANTFSNIMLSNLNSETINYNNANSIGVFLIIALAVFSFMSFGHFLAVRKIYKLDLIESLKTRE